MWTPLKRRKNYYKNSSQKNFWNDINNLSTFGGEDENGFKFIRGYRQLTKKPNIVFIEKL